MAHHWQMPAYPDDPYLTQIGRLAYAVSGLEWSVLGDLPRHAAVLPPALNVGALAGQTTGRIARAIQQHLHDVQDQDVQAWLKESASALLVVSDIRNHVLHARPATLDGQQRLYRWRQGRDSFPITDQWLEEETDLIEAWSAKVVALRVMTSDTL
jgi:hypothetical protein